MPLKITVDATTLLNETRRTGVMGKIGWDTGKMDVVREALKAYHENDSEENRRAVVDAVYTWKLKNPKEFANRDRIGKGIATKLAVQCGLDDYRPAPTPSVRFHGERRDRPTKRKDPRVTPLQDSVVNVLRANAATSAVVIIDLYGEDFAKQGLNLRYGSQATVAEHVIQLLQATRMESPRGPVNIPVYVCAKEGMADVKALVGDFKREIASSEVHLVKSKTNSVLRNTGLREMLAGVETVFVAGFDANMCVAVSIFGSNPGAVTYSPGFLDEGFDVVTSRYIVASGDIPLRAQDGWPYMGPCNK